MRILFLLTGFIQCSLFFLSALNLSMKGPDKSKSVEESSENNNNCSDRVVIKHSALKRRSQNVYVLINTLQSY